MARDKDTIIKLAVLASIVILTVTTISSIVIFALLVKERTGALLPAFLGFLTPIIIGLLAVLRSSWKVEDKIDSKDSDSKKTRKDEEPDNEKNTDGCE